MLKEERKKKKWPCRIPTAKPTEVHKDKKKYTRKVKHKKKIGKK